MTKSKLAAATVALFLVIGGVSFAASQAGEDSLLSQSWTTMQTASLYQRYKKQNPGESARLEAYWANGGTVPSIATAFGKALLLEAQAYWSLHGTSADTTPPAVTLTSPVNGSVVSGTIAVSANATDNVGVTKVEFSRDGSVFAMDTTAPYAVSFDTATVTNGSHTFGPRAYDAAGNATSGAAVTVTVSNAAPPPPTGQLFLAPNGSDSNPCTLAAPCRTVERGYQAAQSGDSVVMADGFYPCANLSGTKTVTFVGDGTGTTSGSVPWITCTSGRPKQDGVAVSVRVSSGGNITFDGVYMAGLALARGQTSNITLRNVHITCENDAAHFQLYSGQCTGSLEQGANNFTMTGGEIGPSLELANEGSGSHTFGDNTTFDNVTFHDNLPLFGHSELLLVWSGNPLTIKNSRFLNWGGTAAIYFSEYGTVGASNVLLENNFVGKTSSSQIYAIYIGTLTAAGGTRNYDIRYNTVYNGVYSDKEPSDGSTMIGNVMGYVQCKAGFSVYDHNVFGDDLGRGCGTNSVTVPSNPYTCSGCGFDSTGHLTSSSAAIGRGSPSDFPPKDIDGQARPIGVVDAGSDER